MVLFLVTLREIKLAIKIGSFKLMRKIGESFPNLFAEKAIQLISLRLTS
jgi:hypothetical protein